MHIRRIYISLMPSCSLSCFFFFFLNSCRRHVARSPPARAYGWIWTRRPPLRILQSVLFLVVAQASLTRYVNARDFSSALHIRPLSLSVRVSPGGSPFPELKQQMITENHTQQRSYSHMCVIQRSLQSCSRLLQNESRRKEATYVAAEDRLSQLTSYVRVGVDRLQLLKLLHAALLGGVGARGSKVRDAHERSFFIGSSRCRRGSRAHVFPVAVLTASGGEA